MMMNEPPEEQPAPEITAGELRELVDAARVGIWVIEAAAAKDGPDDHYWHVGGGGRIVLDRLKSIVPRVEEIVFGPRPHAGGPRSRR